MITHTTLVAGNLRMKTWVARQRPTSMLHLASGTIDIYYAVGGSRPHRSCDHAHCICHVLKLTIWNGIFPFFPFRNPYCLLVCTAHTAHVHACIDFKVQLHVLQLCKLHCAKYTCNKHAQYYVNPLVQIQNLVHKFITCQYHSLRSDGPPGDHA